jgi:hypothetical protein
MDTRLLTDDEFHATFVAPMRNVMGQGMDVPDIWPYVDSILPSDLEGHAVYDGLVAYVYRSADGRFDHVLVMTRTKNVYLAVVVDLTHDAIYGHRLLDINRLYGLAK